MPTQKTKTNEEQARLLRDLARAAELERTKREQRQAGHLYQACRRAAQRLGVAQNNVSQLHALVRSYDPEFDEADQPMGVDSLARTLVQKHPSLLAGSTPTRLALSELDWAQPGPQADQIELEGA